MFQNEVFQFNEFHLFIVYFRISAVWKDFERMSGGTQAKCKICQKVYKTGGGTSNLRNHLMRKHGRTIAVNQESHSQTKSSTYGQNSEKKRRIDVKIGLMIACDFQPYSIVEDIGFRELVKELDPKYPMVCRQTLTNSIVPELFRYSQEAVSNILENIDYVALAVDSWTSRASDAYIGITCHFIDSDWKMNVISLDTVLVTEAENADYVSRVVLDVCDDWGIRNKVVAMVTDEAAVMIKAADISGYKHIPCVCHVMNTVIRNAVNWEEIDQLDVELTSLFTKCRSIVSFFHRSAKATRLLETYKVDSLEDGECKPTKLVQMVNASI